MKPIFLFSFAILILLTTPNSFADKPVQLFQEEMAILAPLIPAGWQLAKTYTIDSRAPLDYRIARLSDSYFVLDLNKDVRRDVVMVLEEIPSLNQEESNGFAKRSWSHGQRKVVIYLKQPDGTMKLFSENTVFIPHADEGGVLGDSLAKVSLTEWGSLQLEFWGRNLRTWNYTFFFKLGVSDFLLFAQNELISDPITSSWELRAKNFSDATVTLTTGGYDREGKGWTTKPVVTPMVPAIPVRNLRDLNKLTP